MEGYLNGEKECSKKRRIKKESKKKGKKEGPTVRIESQRKQRGGRVPKSTNQSASTNCFVGNGY